MNSKTIPQYISLLTALLLILLGITSARGLTKVSLIVGLILVLAIITMVVCIRQEWGERTVFGTLGIIFIAIYGVLISSNYFIQLSAFMREVNLVDSMDMSSPSSIFWMVEILGYFFMGMSTLALAPLFKEGAYSRPIQILLILNAVLVAGGILGYLLNWGNDLMLVGLLSWNIIVAIAAFLIFLRFRQNNSTQN